MSEQQILSTLCDTIREISPDLAGKPIGRESSMRDLGLNSLERAEVIIDTLSALNLRMPMTAFAGAANLGELAGIMARAR